MPAIRELTQAHVDKIVDVLTDSFSQDPLFHYLNNYPNQTTDIKVVCARTRRFFTSYVYSAFMRGARVFSVVELSEDSPEDPALFRVLAVAVWIPPDYAGPSFWTSLWSGEFMQKWSVGKQFYERLVNGFIQHSIESKKRIFSNMASEGRLPSGSDSSNFRYWHLAFLAVRQASQGQGLGRALLRYSLHLIDGMGYHAVLESSTLNNAKYVYSKHGFVEEDRFELDDGKVVVPVMVRPPRTGEYFKS